MLSNILKAWRNQPTPHPVVIVSVMLEHDGELLLGRRIGSNAAGLLSTPGGKVDYREPLKKAAARELYEETGLIIDSDDLVVLGFKEHPNRYGGHYITFYLTARFAQCSGTLHNREPHKCVGWAWAGLDAIPLEDCTEPPSVLATWRAYWRARAAV